MNEVAFVEQREPDWRRLAYLTEKADVSPRQLTPPEFQEYVRLYRRCASDLARVRTKSNNLQLIEFLNDLVGKAYSSLYESRRKPIFQAITDAVLLAARTGRKLRWFLLASLLTFFGGAGFGFVASATNPAVADILMPASMKESADSWIHGSEPDRTASESSLMTGFYSSNNIKVGIIQAGASAATFGFGGAYSLWTNGSLLGVLSYQTMKVGRLAHLLIWVSPHGASEITGFIVSGGAGYALAWALIAPGRRKRSVALKDAGKDAIVLLCTSVVMIAAAAPVEGFFSYNTRIPDWAKIVFAVCAFSAWTAFFFGFGREPAAVERVG